jgi:uncharacterized membrane protein
MDLARTVKHLLTTRRSVKRCFSESGLAAIDKAIAESKVLHGGEIRFAIEPALHPAQLWRNLGPRERAVELFSELRVWDTEHNSGVLIYVLLADRAIEIVADRGVHVRVGATGWTLIADAMRADFAAGRFQEGALDGIAAISRELLDFLPTGSGDPGKRYAPP